MVDAADLKSATLTGVWVRIPPSAPTILIYPIFVPEFLRFHLLEPCFADIDG